MKVTREVYGGVAWLELDEGRLDVAYDPTYGWVSICWDYVQDGVRNLCGIRWEMGPEDCDLMLIPEADLEWCKNYGK